TGSGIGTGGGIGTGIGLAPSGPASGPASGRDDRRGSPAGTAFESQTQIFEIARAYGSLCEIFIQNNEPLELEYSCLRVLNLTRRFGPSPELSRAFGFMGLIQGAARRHARAEAYLKWAREAEEANRDVTTRVSALLRNGAYHLYHGDWRAVTEAMDKALMLCDQLGDARQRAEAAVTLAQACVYSGEIARGRALFTDLAAAAQDNGHVQPQCRAISGQVSCLLRTGETLDATSALEQHLMLQESNPERMALLVWHAQMAVAYARAAKPELAWKEAETVERLIVETPMTYVPDAYFGLAEVYHTLLELPAERHPAPRRLMVRRFAKAVRRGRRIARHFAAGEPMAWLWQGLYHWVRGRKRLACKAWVKSHAAAHRLAMPYEEGLAALELGRHLPEGDPDRQRHLEEAVKLFAKLGAGDERRARKALGQDTWSAPAPRRLGR
ncbi:MAG: hypothetical protein FJZ00_12335, partial [Candidatus Sericytochromatia bacterium]|nr:hypothetical protein [Candidatus Tanganyikabacteria bacterium]